MGHSQLVTEFNRSTGSDVKNFISVILNIESARTNPFILEAADENAVQAIHAMPRTRHVRRYGGRLDGRRDHVSRRDAATHQVLFAAPEAASYSGVPLAGIVQKYTVLPPAFNVCSGFQVPMSKA